MAMPRPSGRAQKIAEQVIPGLNKMKKPKSSKKLKTGSLSEVEVMQTNNIENKKGLER